MRSAAIFVFVLFLAAIASGGALDLNVVYPKADQKLPPVDSNYIFGSVAPGSQLSINGHSVDVHKDGGWLAFLPVQPGKFTYWIEASNGDIVDTLNLTVMLPEPPPPPTYETLSFVAGSFLPDRQLSVMPGDQIQLQAQSQPYCNVYCVIQPVGDTIVLAELPAQRFTIGTNVFKAEREESEDPESEELLVRGVYRGTYTAPDTGGDSLQLIYYVTAPRLNQIVSIELEWPKLFKGVRDWHEVVSLSPAVHAHHTKVEILDPTEPRIVELTDSLNVIRTGPQKGYLCVHQPAGIRGQLLGKDGPWTKIRLSRYQFGWVPDTGIVYLPRGATAPHSYIRRITTIGSDKSVGVIFGTTARHAFRIVEDEKRKSLTVFIYGADSDTDFLRFDNSEDFIDRAEWFQTEPGLYACKIYLNAGRLWGYNATYRGNQLVLNIRKFPHPKYRIADIRFVLDPGHSPDPGAIGPTGLEEKEINLILAQRLRHELEKEGAEVVLTRYANDSLPLYDRPKIAVKEKAEIFISIHNNALPAGTNPFTNNGVSTYYYHPHSRTLAQNVQTALARNLALPDFGLYYGNFAVIRPTEYPAILVECAFMMLPEQEALLRTERFQKQVAKAIVEGIRDFLRGHPKTAWEKKLDISYGR